MSVLICKWMIALESREIKARIAQVGELLTGGDSSDSAGLLRGLSAVLGWAEGCRQEWRLGYFERTVFTEGAVAEQAFRSDAESLRSRFEHEIFRNADGRRERRAGPAFEPDSSVGGMVLSVLLALESSAPKEESALGDGARSVVALAGLEALRAVKEKELLGLEVVWTPADAGERCSLASLQESHPELGTLR
mgnify:CR=1 FL=1